MSTGEPTAAYDDTRPVSNLVVDYTQRVHDWQPTVGRNGVTAIKVYRETGEMAYVTWYAIYVGEEIVWRVNAYYVVEVGYGNK